MVILGWNDAADHHENVRAAERLERVHERRNEREMTCGQRTDTDHVHVVLDRLARDLVGRLKERPHVHVEAQVREGSGHDFLTAIVPVLPHLHDQDARTTALFREEIFT